MYTPSLEKLIAELSKLPGIGEKTAERLAFHMLINRDDALKLATAIHEVVKKTTHCQICYNFAENTPCSICADSRRDREVICVVEEPKDVLAIERSENYHGLYHVLMGRVAPLEKKGPENLTIPALIKRVEEHKIREIILATNPTLEGDGTALYIAKLLGKFSGMKISRIGRGISWGLNLSYANKASLADALSSRHAMDAE
jgi:recombination protein RecR